MLDIQSWQANWTTDNRRRIALILGLVALLFPFAATAYGLLGAIETYQGRDFQYWWVGDFVRNRELTV